jgi:hypothetical protein
MARWSPHTRVNMVESKELEAWRTHENSGVSAPTLGFLTSDATVAFFRCTLGDGERA